MAKWLSELMEEKFFRDCRLHEARTKNIFCLYCCTSICLNCALDHLSHRLLQVRRNHNSALFKLDELKEHIDCSQIQIYPSNMEQLIHLRRQPRFQASNIKKNICSFCENYIDSGYSYCCLTCKAKHVWQQKKGGGSTDASEFLLVESKKPQRKRPVNEVLDGDQQKNVNDQRNKKVFDGDQPTNINDQRNKELFDGDHTQITPVLPPTEFVNGEGSSSGWSLSDIVESCRKKR